MKKTIKPTLMTMEQIKRSKKYNGNWVIIGDIVRDEETNRIAKGRVLIYGTNKREVYKKGRQLNLNEIGAFYIGERKEECESYLTHLYSKHSSP